MTIKVTDKSRFVKPGSEINEFEKICEVQSDKASVDISSRFTGKVVKLYHDVHDIAKVGTPLVDIETDEDDVENEDKEIEENIEEKAEPVEEDKRGKIPTDDESHSVLASPAVRGLAKEKKLNLKTVKGTGKDGRILKEDVLKAEQDSMVPKKKKENETEERTERLSMIQKAMFKSMTKSLAIPKLGFNDDIIIDNASQYRESINQNLAENPGKYEFGKISYLPIFIKSLSVALSHYPIINARLEEENLVYRSSHNIGIAIDSPQGLIVPNIKNVQTKSIFDIASDFHRLQMLAKSNSLTMDDLKGGTISLSNIGSIGGTYANPVIVSNELAICALGRIQRLPRFDKDNNVVSKMIMPVSWSADHRVIDGATIAKFGNHWKRLIENPSLLTSELR